MTAPTLIRRLAVRLDLPTYRAGFALRQVVEEVRAALVDGETVTLSGLGSLRVKSCSSRFIKDFRGETRITRGRKVSFKPSKSLRSLLF